jgi:hypothetical protein
MPLRTRAEPVVEHETKAPEIYVDIPGAPTWRPIASVYGWSLRLAPDLVARGAE